MRYATFSYFLFALFAACFVVIAGHHLVEVFFPHLRPDYPVNRHIVLIFINLLLAYFMLRRSKLALCVLFLIAIQQLYGHGDNVYQSLRNAQAPHYTDWVVLIFIPVLLYAYTLDVFKKDRDMLKKS